MPYEPPRPQGVMPPMPPRIPAPSVDDDSVWPPPGSTPSDLSTLPPHVRRFLNRHRVRVATASQRDISQISGEQAHKLKGMHVSGLFDRPSRTIKLRDEVRQELFPGRVPNDDPTPHTSVARHEGGHAVDMIMAEEHPELSSMSQRFRNICRKYQAGTPGGGGGLGEYVAPYLQNCEELYGTLLGIYQGDDLMRERLKRHDPQSWEFMRQVDAAMGGS